MSRPSEHPSSSPVVQGRRPSEKTPSTAVEKTKTNMAVQPVREKGIVQKAVQYANQSWEKKSDNLVRTVGGMDRTMLFLTLLLIAAGSVMILSASAPSALAEKGKSLHYFLRHMVFVAIGLAALYGISRLPLGFIEDVTPLAFLAATGLLIFVLIPTPFSLAQGAARRWLIFGSITVQPSELMKAALILMLARYLGRHQQDMIPDTKRLSIFRNGWKYSVKYFFEFFLKSTVVPGIFVVIACGLVLAENHLSGTLIMGMIGFVVLFMGGVPWYLLFSCVGLVGGIAVSVFLSTKDYAKERIESFINKENVDLLDEGWQTAQGQYAIGSGGLLGTGLGGSRQKYSYVSEPQNDFIFTILCEEMGFVGAVVVILLFILFLWRGVVIAMRAPTVFSSLAVLGVVAHVGIQAFLNIAVVTGSIPNTGISLPFFSYGGTSTVVLLAEMGVLLGVSRHSYIQK